MNTSTHSLLTFYKGWQTYQRMLVNVVAPLSEQQLELSISPAKWSIRKTLQHVIANRVWWFQVWMNEGSHDLAPIADWDPSAPTPTPTISAPELVRGLHATWGMIESALSRWTPDDLAQVFDAPSAMSAEEREMFGSASRQWIIWHVFEHEIHHGGEISLVLGANGLHGIYGEM